MTLYEWKAIQTTSRELPSDVCQYVVTSEELFHDYCGTLFGVTKDEPEYDPNCDVDGDGLIDIEDISNLQMNYVQAKKCEPLFPVNLDELKQQARDGALGKISEVFQKEFADKGIAVKIIDYNVDVAITLREELRQHDVLKEYMIRRQYATLKVTTTVQFETDYELFGSPIDPITGAILIKIAEVIITAIVTVLIAYFIIQAIEDWLKSMTTKTTTIKRYDEEGNLIEEETTTEPSVEGIAGVGIIFIVIVFILLIFVMVLPSRGKKS